MFDKVVATISVRRANSFTTERCDVFYPEVIKEPFASMQSLYALCKTRADEDEEVFVAYKLGDIWFEADMPELLDMLRRASCFEEPKQVERWETYKDFLIQELLAELGDGYPFPETLQKELDNYQLRTFGASKVVIDLERVKKAFSNELYTLVRTQKVATIRILRAFVPEMKLLSARRFLEQALDAHDDET